jgi:hypothetical protein
MTDRDVSSAASVSRISFGKYKGTLLSEALLNTGLLEWIKGLSLSPIPKAAAIGVCYLESLQRFASESGIEIHTDPESEHLQVKIAEYRDRIAELDFIFTQELQAVEGIRSKLFLLLRPTYEKLDTLCIKVEYRYRFLEALLQGRYDDLEIIAEEEQHARSSNHQVYEEADQSASRKPVLNEQERTELRTIYRKHAALYNPDKFASDPKFLDSYTELIKHFNQAKDAGDINVLRDIAENPNQFLESTGRQSIDLDDSSEFESLQLLCINLQEEIKELQKRLDELRSSGDYELWKLCEHEPDLLNAITHEQIRDLEKEALKLEAEGTLLADEINQTLDPDSPLRI